MQIYVDGNAVRSGNGQKEYPFQTISEGSFRSCELPKGAELGKEGGKNRKARR